MKIFSFANVAVLVGDSDVEIGAALAEVQAHSLDVRRLGDTGEQFLDLIAGELSVHPKGSIFELVYEPGYNAIRPLKPVSPQPHPVVS